MSDWSAAPSAARWYGEVIVSRPGETDYHYGYSTDDDPDVGELVPKGWDLRESKRVELDR
ncbi:hypothetical protein [Amycolatopsis lexingtonensis]|uniref:hypothetical protein n=1 Tax=Amycolatopsis lexingtonensis TaxID=218822 RepID=UPI003F6E75CF